MEIPLNGYDQGIVEPVYCPLCHDEWQHHLDTVEVFTREGGEDGQSFSTLRGMISNKDNPSTRRDAIRIVMHGECGHVWYLDIIQHKGHTYLSASV